MPDSAAKALQPSLCFSELRLSRVPSVEGGPRHTALLVSREAALSSIPI